jgi:predicted DNA-binding transcriptional regulator YafY
MENATEKVKPLDHNKRVFDMIGLLRKNGRMKAHELATAMGFKNTRSINKYKNQIEKMGLQVQTFGGFYGGYELVQPNRLTEYELNLVKSYLPANITDKIKNLNDGVLL